MSLNNGKMSELLEFFGVLKLSKNQSKEKNHKHSNLKNGTKNDLRPW